MTQQLTKATGMQAALAIQDGSYSGTFFDARGGVEFNPADNHLLYANVSTGHKSGSFNDNVAANIAPAYKPETIIAFEVGSKNEFLDRKLLVNASVFDYEYSDQVFQNIQHIADPMDPTKPGFSSAVRNNVGKSRVLGVELEGKAHLPGGFVLSAEALILDAKITNGTVRDTRLGFGAGDSPSVSVDGNWMPRASRLTANYSIGQNIRSSIGWFDWVISAQTRTKHFMTIFNGEGADTAGNPNPNLTDVVPAYTRFDVGAGYSKLDGKLRFDAFITNVTNLWYMTSLINTPGLNLRFINPPRQVGVRATMYF